MRLDIWKSDVQKNNYDPEKTLATMARPLVRPGLVPEVPFELVSEDMNLRRRQGVRLGISEPWTLTLDLCRRSVLPLL